MDQVNRATIGRMADPTSTLLKIGKFDVIVDVGRGGFGIVFRAHDPELDRLVALKLCRARPSAIDALLDEARLQAKLDRYPNIVTIYDQGRHDGAAFIAMQFIAGQNAERFAERDPAPSVQEILRVYRDVARGLAAAHREKIVHGDIKPSNVLLDLDDFARITDFGLGRRVIEDADESEQEGLRRRAGTLWYMAPEVLCGQPCGARSDQFSFFVALCQTLARGKLPFYGKSSGEVLDAIERTDILQFLGMWVPAELKAVIRIGLSIDPSERFPNMEMVEAEIDRLLQMPPRSSPPRDEPELDEPEFDGPEFDESDGPDQMHEPARSDETALLHGEPLDEPEPESAPDELPRLIPIGGAPGLARKPRRGAFAVALVLVGALGWAGGRVESSGSSGPVPVPLPSPSPCASVRPNAKIDAAVVAVCERIREGDLERATDSWYVEFQGRREWSEARAEGGEITEQKRVAEVVQLGADTMIVARTFLARAHASERDEAVWSAQVWAFHTASVLGPVHPEMKNLETAFARWMLMLGASDVKAQAERLKSLDQAPSYSSQHQIEPSSSSTYP